MSDHYNWKPCTLPRNYFPIKIELKDSKEVMVCQRPEDVPRGVALIILQTFVKEAL